MEIYGKNKKDLDKIIDSIKLQNSGAVALLLEGMKTNIKKITEITKIPTIGIGASSCDGQILFLRIC